MDFSFHVEISLISIVIHPSVAGVHCPYTLWVALQTDTQLQVFYQARVQSSRCSVAPRHRKIGTGIQRHKRARRVFFVCDSVDV
jgi:hypothetical protein